MAADSRLGGDICIYPYDERHPDERHGQALILAELDGEKGNDEGDDDGLEDGLKHRLDRIALFDAPCAPGKRAREEHDGGKPADHKAEDIYPLSAEEVRHVAVRAAAENADEGLIRDGKRLALKHDVGKTAEHEHACKRGDERRHMHEGYPERLPCADRKAEQQHEDDDEPHVQPLAEPDRAQRADKANNGADGKVDIAAGEDAQQHTGCQHENISVLGDYIGDILRHEYLAVCAHGEERQHEQQDKHHRILLDKVLYLVFTHMPFLLYLCRSI